MRPISALPVPRPSPTKLDIAIVLGCAEGIWDDLDELFCVYGAWDGLVFVVNDVGIQVPYFDDWVTLHPENFERDPRHPERIGWKEERGRLGLDDRYQTWSRRGQGCDHWLNAKQTGGSSGLVATMAAIQTVGPEGRVALAGIPMDRGPHFAESLIHPTGKGWSGQIAHWPVWNKKATLVALLGHAKSMSGKTRTLLGAPTAAWLRGEE